MSILSLFILHCLVANLYITSNAEPIVERNTFLKRFILHHSYPRCSELSKTNHETCEIHSQDDATSITRGCGFPPCTDGSINRTCIILSYDPDGDKTYSCMCKNDKLANLSSSDYQWTVWSMYSSVGLYREITDVLVAENDILAREYRFGIVYIDKANNYFPVESWLGSSAKDLGWYWSSRKMSVSRTLGWVPERSDNDPFLQLDMGQPYQVIGMYLQKHYDSNDEPNYITSYNVKYSHDETSFVYVGMNLPVVYKPGFDNTTCWFDNSTEAARYWRLEPGEYVGLRLIKGDFIGYI